MRRVYRLAPFAAGLMVLAACSGTTAADEVAQRDARDRVDQIVARASADYASWAEDYAHIAAQLDEVEVMRVEGTRRSVGDGVTLIVRVHGHGLVPAQAGQPAGRSDLTVCYRLVFDFDSRDAVDGTIDCPDGAPLAIPKDPKLPAGIDDELRAELHPGASEDAVRTAVAALTLDPGITREVTSGSGSVGVALRASRYDCVMARVSRDQVQVWRPSHIQLAPGEGSCTAGEARVGSGLKPPH